MNNKIILGLSILALSNVASADPFYVDIGTNYAPGNDKVKATSTSLKNELTYIYESQSVVTDLDANGIDVGDTITTQGGYGIGGPSFGDIGNNQVTGFNPSESFGDNADNGYGGSNWLLTFSFTGLQGIITDYTAGSTLEIAYGAFGHFDLFVTEDGTTFNNFMDLIVTGAKTVSGGTLLTALVDFTNVDAGYNDIFHSGNRDCAGDDSFEAIVGCGAPPMEINFLADFNTNAATIDIIDNLDGTFDLNGNHDGSAVFNSVPEPSVLALLGVGLSIFGFASRRKNNISIN